MPRKILIVEDDDTIRENLAEMLLLWGFSTQEASNGLVAQELISRYQPDLILCDINMPILDGYGLLAWVQKDPVLRNIPFIFLSASAQSTDIEKGKMSGVTAYLTKPITGVQLRSTIQEYMKE